MKSCWQEAPPASPRSSSNSGRNEWFVACIYCDLGLELRLSTDTTLVLCIVTLPVLYNFELILYRDYFGKELNDHIDPDVTVAYGAASILD